MPNPYTLVFGQPPIEFIERKAQSERIISEFCQERPSNYLNLITGIHGCGKTVFMTQIANRLRDRKEWVVVNLNPQRDMLISLAAKLDSNRAISRILKETEVNLSAFGIGIGIKEAPPISDIEEALIRMIRGLQKHGKRLLITVDEATNSKEMRIFASSYQLLLREELPVFLLMTGLHAQIDRLRNADGMTFLERAPRTELSPLNFTAMVGKYKDTLQVEEETAIRLAKATKGYSFAFQTVGYFFWEHRPDMNQALENAQDYLEEFAYQKIWSELSEKDRIVVTAISHSRDGQIQQIREELNWTSNQFNPYRDRLLKAGIILAPQNGFVQLALPWFGEFAEKCNAEAEAPSY